MTKEEFLKSLDEIGWFDYLQNDREKITNKIKESEGDYYLDLHHFSLFSDDFYSTGDYKNFIQELEKISDLNFDLPEINVNEDDNRIDVKVIIQNKEFDMSFDLDESMIIPQIEKHFNELFTKLEIDSRLLWLPLESDIFFYVFIPVELYKKAVKSGLIPNEPDYLNNL